MTPLDLGAIVPVAAVLVAPRLRRNMVWITVMSYAVGVWALFARRQR